MAHTIKLAALACAGTLLGVSQAAVLDFQTLSDGVTTPPNVTGAGVPNPGDATSEIGSEYAGIGIVFSSNGEDSGDLGPTFGNFSGFLAPGNIAAQDFKRSASTFNIRMDFAFGTSFLSGDIIGPDGDMMTGTAYDAGGNILDTFTTGPISGAGGSEAFLLSSAGPLIAYVIVQSADSPIVSGVAVDNLDFDAVPIPGAAILFGSAFAAYSAARKRKKA
ncbi:hypothetical protein HK107_02360 [Parvularcula sp. ZS-1/3]|uniref:VPLPA-CTERM sorting domain-containing protein n=1 Tax=Parvularcula mediterranea TaxID=2732508 RepID=A0A7Y3RJE0_9PROT|nr:hypothetical protein [Parvularcula mediterranea]NNU15167.1 hypothetical protein [Parvularcula mediterranea]